MLQIPILNLLKPFLDRIVAWQKRPITPATMAEEETVCKNCEQSFVGNYCPRCGQSRITPRLGSRNALRIFLDTWGLGTHSLLRTLWHLLARPGYMIGDYIEGRRQPYFPPFKTLFVVGTAFTIVFALSGGFNGNAQRDEAEKVFKESIEQVNNDIKEVSKTAEEKLEEERMNAQFVQDMTSVNNLFHQYGEWQKEHRALDQLFMHIIFAIIAWRLFRNAPRHPGLNLSENIIAQVYICAQMGAIATFVMLAELPFAPSSTGNMPIGLGFLLFIYDFKQLYGYRLGRTIWKTFLMHLIFSLISVLFFAIGLLVIAIRIGIAAVGP